MRSRTRRWRTSPLLTQGHPLWLAFAVSHIRQWGLPQEGDGRPGRYPAADALRGQTRTGRPTAAGGLQASPGGAVSRGRLLARGHQAARGRAAADEPPDLGAADERSAAATRGEYPGRCLAECCARLRGSGPAPKGGTSLCMTRWPRSLHSGLCRCTTVTRAGAEACGSGRPPSTRRWRPGRSPCSRPTRRGSTTSSGSSPVRCARRARAPATSNYPVGARPRSAMPG